MKPLTRSELEFKAIPLDLKRFAPDTGEFEGYASTFGNEDQGQDIVMPGAFADSLKLRDAGKVKMLYEHDPCQPIGKWLELREDERGLFARGQLLIEKLAKAREVHALMAEKILDGLSIGFRVVKSETGRGSEAVRKLLQVDLREISAVLFPMNELADIHSVKADLLPTERDFERWCTQDAASLGLKMTRSEVRQYLMPGFKSLLKAKQDAGGEVASNATNADAALLTDVLRRFNEGIR